MSLEEKIMQRVHELSDSKRAEVLDFVEYLVAKLEKKENEDWSNISLSSAMSGIAEEPTPYSVSIPEPPEFANLSKTEQIRYLQGLWDSIAERPDEIPVPESHIKLVEERLAKYHRDPSDSRSAFDVLDRLAKKTQ